MTNINYFSWKFLERVKDRIRQKRTLHKTRQNLTGIQFIHNFFTSMSEVY